MLSFISLVFIGLSLIETIRQRTTSYKPKILITPQTFFLQCNKDGIPAIWKNEPEDFYSANMTGSTNRVQIELYNAGVGPGIDITCKWDFDKYKIIEGFLGLSNSSPNLVKFDTSNNTVTIRSIGEKSSYSIKYKLFQNDEKYITTISSIPPFSDNHNPKIEFPRSFSMFLSVYSYAMTVMKKTEKIAIDTPLRLKMSYYDTAEKKYKNSKEIFFSFTNLSDGLIQVNEKPLHGNTNFALCLFHMK